MKRLWLFIPAFIFLAAFLAGPAQAEKIDFGKVTCAEFMEFDEDSVAALYFWLDGYFSAKTGDLVLDTDNVESDMQALFEMCQANPKTPLLKVIGQ